MLKKLIIIALLIIINSVAYSQYFFYDDRYYDNDLLFEAGLSVGLMNAVSDVGEKKGSGISPSYYDWKSSQFNFAAHFSVMYKSTVEARLQLTRGSAAGKDANSNSAFVRHRNLSYKSSITELTLLGIVHPIMIFDLDHLPALSPYLMAGVGVFSFYPRTLYNGELVPLRRQNTEGQNTEAFPSRKQYSLRSVSIPIGGGLKYEFNARFNFRFEGLFRFTNTDYLDDASTTYVPREVLATSLQRALAHRYKEVTPTFERTGQVRAKAYNKDKFFTINLSVGYVLGREKRPTAGKR